MLGLDPAGSRPAGDCPHILSHRDWVAAPSSTVDQDMLHHPDTDTDTHTDAVNG